MSKIRDTDRAKRVQHVFDFWTVALGLEGSWHVSYGFVDSINNHTSFAEVHQNMPYLKATIMFDRVCLDGSTEQELEAAIVHELMHIMLSPLGQLIKDEFGSGALATDFDNALETCCDGLAEKLIYLRHGKASAYYDPQLPFNSDEKK